jgi:hypothetical protein
MEAMVVVFEMSMEVEMVVAIVMPMEVEMVVPMEVTMKMDTMVGMEVEMVVAIMMIKRVMKISNVQSFWIHNFFLSPNFYNLYISVFKFA